ncbi:RTA1-like protein [Mycena belliarum]|uniref:RTA1-like protein n=1 Tax=Mycena belliarum TaxID=1033014 RepID=A0AAD6U4Q1_9AGAR|nr:RTA1-like protein [Mycena belliae]
MSVYFPRSDSAASEGPQYGYTPHEYVAIIFVVLFGISTIMHIGQATYYRMWWMLPTACLCGIGELVGWSGRLWSSFSPILSTPFMMQMTTTVLAPTPLIAVNFVLMSRIVTRLGPCYARLSPRQYTTIFLFCDIGALSIQAIGGGVASSADTLSGANMGANIILAGIVLQFVAIIVYSVLLADFLRRFIKDRPLRVPAERGTLDRKLRTLVQAIAFSTLMLFARSIYRIIELSGGWDGRILHTEVYFNVFDGGLVVLAIFTMNAFHPGRLLRTRDVDAYGEKLGSRVTVAQV